MLDVEMFNAGSALRR